MGRLDLRIVEARNLKNPDMFGKPDPYVTIEVEGAKHETSAKSDTLNPRWEEVFKFNIADEHSAQLHFKIWNKEIGFDDFMGEYYLSIAGLTKGQVYDQWLLLRNTQMGELRVRIQALDFGNDVPAPTAQYYPAPQPTILPPTFVPPPPAPTYMPASYQTPIFYPPQPVGIPPSVQKPTTIDEPSHFQHHHHEHHSKWSIGEHGSLYHEDGTGKIYLLIDLELRHVPSQEVFFALFKKPLDPNQLNRFPAGSAPHPIGEPLPHDVRLVRPDGEPDVYLLDHENGRQVRRHVTSSGIFEILDFDWGKIRVEDPQQVMNLPRGTNVPRTPTDGCLFHNDDTGAVYILLDGGLRHIQNPEQYYRLFEIPLDPSHFKRFRGNLVYPVIHPVPLEAGLIRPDGRPEVFLIDLQGGRLVRRHITNQEVFFRHNFHFNDVHVHPIEHVEQYPAGTPIGEETPMPADHRLFYNERNGSVGLLIDYELRHVPNPDMYNRVFSVPLDPSHFHKYNFYSGYAEGPKLHEQARFVRPAGHAEVYYIDLFNGREVKRHVKSGDVMTRNRFKWEAVQEVPESYTNAIPNGPSLL